MAENREGLDRGSSEPAGYNKENDRKKGWQMPGVNFEEMNFEQRRVPYHSIHKNEGDQNFPENGHGPVHESR